MKNIGNSIKERRKMLNITQRELAGLARVSINTLTKIERGEANPSYDVLHRILITLGLEIEVKIKIAEDKKQYYAKSVRVSTKNIRRGVKGSIPK